MNASNWLHMLGLYLFLCAAATAAILVLLPKTSNCADDLPIDD